MVDRRSLHKYRGARGTAMFPASPCGAVFALLDFPDHRTVFALLDFPDHRATVRHQLRTTTTVAHARLGVFRHHMRKVSFRVGKFRRLRRSFSVILQPRYETEKSCYSIRPDLADAWQEPGPGKS